MGLLAPVLGTLHMELCFYGFQNVITSETLQSLWTCHKLRGLYLESIDDRIEAEHIEAGLQHLRFAAVALLSVDVCASVNAYLSNGC